MIVILIMVAAVFLIIEGAHWHVYGSFIKEDELDAYLTKYWDTMQLNPYSDDSTLFCDLPRYVARSSSFLSKWSIERSGTIPRWSPWSKKLDQKRAELMAANVKTKKTLKDY